MKRLALWTGCVLLLVACVPAQPRWVWTHPRLGDAEREAAMAECRRLTHHEAPIPFFAYPSGSEFYEEREGLFNDCMEQRGWKAKRR